MKNKTDYKKIIKSNKILVKIIPIKKVSSVLISWKESSIMSKKQPQEKEIMKPPNLYLITIKISMDYYLILAPQERKTYHQTKLT